MTTPQKTVAVLYPGEMGSAFAALLAARGIRVVTTLRGRGAKTIWRGTSAGITVLPTLEAVVRASDLVVSLVTPSAAQEVSDAYCAIAELAPANAIYIDANSIGPERVRSMARRFDDAGIDLVDGAINGLAKNLAATATFFLSGQRARAVSDLIGAAMRVDVLGEQVGQAAAMKMLLSGMSKGLCALFVETALSAQSRGMLPELIDACSRIYPGVMAVVDRMLPTYRQHAVRRAEEMAEVVAMMQVADSDSRLMPAVLKIHERLAEVDFDAMPSAGKSIASLIAQLAQSEASGASASESPPFSRTRAGEPEHLNSKDFV